jgi:hypothetical protein
MDRIENTSPESSILASCGYRLDRIEDTIPVTVYRHYLAAAVLYKVITYQRVYVLQNLMRCVSYTSGPPTIFYCLSFETSLFVASYDSQGQGGSIRPHHHTGLNCLKLSVGGVI